VTPSWTAWTGRFPRDFSGKTVLDVGCNAGYYSFVAKSRGAERVVAVELDRHFVRQAQYMSTLLGLDVQFLRDDVHNVDTRLGTFDVIICTGLMYHIPDPTNVLARLSDVCADTILIESEFLLDPALTSMARFIEGTYRDDGTNWWIYGPQCLEGMVRAAGQSAEFKTTSNHREEARKESQRRKSFLISNIDSVRPSRFLCSRQASGYQLPREGF
jgi:tRNA (mo5U34)-methyltransferase